VRRELERCRREGPFQLSPKDPDPYPDFYIQHLPDDATEVEFHKGPHVVTVDLRKIAEITPVKLGKTITHVRILGRIAWHPEIDGGRWVCEPTGPVGRPPLSRRTLA